MIQSLLTQEEYNKYSRIYNTYNVSKRTAAKEKRVIKIGDREFVCGPPPNYQMGSYLTEREILYINAAIDILLKDVHRCESNNYPGIPFHP